MIDPSDLNPTDLENEALPSLIDGYLSNGAGMDDWISLIETVRDLGYHVGYRHGREDGKLGIYPKREEFSSK